MPPYVCCYSARTTGSNRSYSRAPKRHTSYSMTQPYRIMLHLLHGYYPYLFLTSRRKYPTHVSEVCTHTPVAPKFTSGASHVLLFVFGISAFLTKASTVLLSVCALEFSNMNLMPSAPARPKLSIYLQVVVYLPINTYIYISHPTCFLSARHHNSIMKEQKWVKFFGCEVCSSPKPHFRRYMSQVPTKT